MNARRLLALLLLASVLPACGGSGSTAPPPPLPTAPTGLAVSGKTSGRIELAWNDTSSNETGFTIERSFDGGSNWSVAGTVGVDVEAFIDRAHHPLDTLSYRVRPTNNPAGYSTPVSDSLEAVAWDSPIGSGPTSRVGHSLLYDDLNERLVLFGGIDAVTGWLADVWVMDLSAAAPGAWTPLATSGGPPTPRFAHTAIYDSDGDRMIVFGGAVDPPVAPPSSPVIGDTWELTLPSAGTATWSLLATTGTSPEARQNHSAVLDPTNGRMLVFAGQSMTSLLSDLRSLDLTTLAWTDHGNAAFGRKDHSAIWDVQNARMILHSGDAGAGAVPETWAAAVPQAGVASWSPLGGSVPFARNGASAVYDEKNRRMIVFGGAAGLGVFNDVWTLPLIPGGAWRQASVGAGPSDRLSASAAYDPLHERMMIFGGDDGTFFPIDDLAYPLLLGTP